MSYVLDALRRADAERQRGSLPGLQSQPQAPAADAGPRSTTVFAAMGAGAVGLLAIGAAVAWWMLRPAAVPPPALTAASVPPAAVTAAVTASAPAAAARTAAPAIEAATDAAATAAASAPSGSASATIAARSPEPIPMPDAVAKADHAYPSKDAAKAAARAPVASTPAAAAPPASAGIAPERLPTLAELPETLRRQIPALQAGGAMDSPQPSARLLIVNGQPFREGDQLAPGLTLQQIRLRSAVLDFRGTRFELRY